MRKFAVSFVTSLYGQVLIGLVGGILLGYLYPTSGTYVIPGLDGYEFSSPAKYMKPLADIFIRGIKMIIGPIILCTIVVGIARAGSGKVVGRLGVKTLFYFEVVTTLALAIGLAAAHIFRPGDGYPGAAAKLDPGAAAKFVKTAEAQPHGLDFFVNLMPQNIVDSFARGDIVQILIFSVLLGLALGAMGERTRRLIDALDDFGHAFLKMIGYVMRLAPLAAFGAMAFTVGEFGIETLKNLFWLILCLYGACLFFILAVLWPVCRFGAGVSLWKLVKYLREEVFITLGTASSEAVLPRMLEKMQKLGATKQVVGFVIPAGYSFNLDGSTLYMPLATLFIAQALGIELSLETQVTMFALLMITSKGIAGVAGASMVVLATTLQASHVIPVAGIALVLGIDRIQNEVRSLTNLIGNAVATLFIARWEKALDLDHARRVLNGEEEPAAA